MSMRMAVGAMVVGVALAIVGAGRVGSARQDVSPARGPLEEASPRSRAAQQIATMLRGEVEVDSKRMIAELPTLEQLAGRRAEIAEQLMDFALVKFVEPPSPSGARGTFHAAIADYIEWSSRRLDASLDLAGSDDDRREAIARDVAKLRRVEQVYRELSQAEGIDIAPQNLLELEFTRLELETRLARLGEGGGN